MLGWLLGLDDGSVDKLGRYDGCKVGQSLVEGLNEGCPLGILDNEGFIDGCSLG